MPSAALALTPALAGTAVMTGLTLLALATTAELLTRQGVLAASRTGPLAAHGGTHN